ncbi:hypothetical protein GJ744_006143 [Endocarpon pusillum]|uniref:Uncharacterized protein n=1 Tax=Endocarpon pusillum TaxID=364733 RepID=A0A8H7A7Z1_9EURO|nr:hypothetical protein GJ744_006143 [Endocarpon pusillum]
MNWFFDWDGTMTTTDTLSVVASIGYTKHRDQKLPPWSYFTDAYLSDYKAHNAMHEPKPGSSKSIEEFLEWQERFVEVERASVERVERAGIFANVSITDIDNAAREAVESRSVLLRPGLVSLIEKIQERGGSTTIVSINWSARFIYSCLGSAREPRTQAQPQKVNIRANEIGSGSSAKLTRTFAGEDRGIWTARDKERIMLAELQAEPQQRSSVYIGDSPSDLSCLLLANVGICIRDNELNNEQSSLWELLHRFNITCRHIGKYSHRRSTDYKSFKRLWWAKDFNEISESALFEYEHVSLE